MERMSEKLFDFVAKIPKSYYLPILLCAAGIVFFSIGLIQLGSNKQDVKSVQGEQIQDTATTSSTFGAIQIDIEGGVMHPGVYKLPFNSRIQDALVAAGGLSGDAARDIVAKSLNLAAKVVDGAKIYVPKVSDAQAVGAGSASDYLGAQVHLIDLNTASESDLDSLPGVGPTTAQKIISARPYSAVEELTSRKIVSASVYTKIKDKVSVY